MSVRAALDHEPLQPGDVVILNDPFAGGTHLPDLTMVAPVFEPSDGFARPVFHVAVRAHHADVGGMSPGSMPLSRDIFQEGIRVPPSKLYRRGRAERGPAPPSAEQRPELPWNGKETWRPRWGR